MAMKRASDLAFPDEEPEFQVAPMIDVLLVLMTFFMSITSTEILRTKTQLDIALPVAKESRKKEKAQGQIIINLAWDPVKKSGVIEFEEKTLSSPSQITEIIQQRKGDQLQFRAIIRAGKEVPYSYVQEVMSICAQSNIDNITFSVLSKETAKKYESESK